MKVVKKRVLLVLIEEETVLESGIIFEDKKSKNIRAKVRAVGSLVTEVREGDTVLINRQPFNLSYNGQDYILTNEDSILGVYEGE